MLYIPKIDGYLEILSDKEVKDFVDKNFNETIRKKENLRKAAKSLYIFLTIPVEVKSSPSDNGVHHYNADILNLIDPELQLINTKPVIKNKLKELQSELKKFKVQTILVLDYKKINNCKIFRLSIKLTTNNLDIDDAFKSMHQNIITKIKSYADKD